MTTTRPEKPTQSSSCARSHEQGFTLIEALIAVVILIFGLVAVAQLLAVAAASNSTANRSTAAAAAASQELERLQTVPFATLALATTAPLPADITAAGACSASAPDRAIAGVGTVRTCWEIDAVNGNMLFIKVRSQMLGPFSRLTQAEFTTFRSLNGGA